MSTETQTHMEKQMAKRERVYSPGPGANASTAFARTYMHHLLLALSKIKQSKPGEDPETYHSKLVKNVRHEVDLALALSARQFAWSRFLKHKLQRDRESSSGDTREWDGQGHHCLKYGGGFSAGLQDEGIGRRLVELRDLLPGGDEMTIEEMLGEIGSYVVCLESQVAVLRCLVDASEQEKGYLL